MGLPNDYSYSGAVRAFREQLSKASTESLDVIAMMVGEVDRSSAVWLRADREKTSVRHQVSEAISRLLEFMGTEVVPKFGASKVLVLGSPLPTVTRENMLRRLYPSKWLIEYVPGSRNRTIFEETVMTLRFNDEMKSRCAAAGLRYVDISSDVLDFETGLLSTFFLPERLDIHLHLERSLFFWRRAILSANGVAWC